MTKNFILKLMFSIGDEAYNCDLAISNVLFCRIIPFALFFMQPTLNHAIQNVNIIFHGKSRKRNIIQQISDLFWKFFSQPNVSWNITIFSFQNNKIIISKREATATSKLSYQLNLEWQSTGQRSGNICLMSQF